MKKLKFWDSCWYEYASISFYRMPNGKTVFYPFWRFDGHVVTPEKEFEIKQFLKYFWVGYSVYSLAAIVLTPFVGVLISFYVDLRWVLFVLLLLPYVLYKYKIKGILRGCPKTRVQKPRDIAIENASLIFTIPRGITISLILLVASALVLVDSIFGLFTVSEAFGRKLGIASGSFGVLLSLCIGRYFVLKRRKIIESRI